MQFAYSFLALFLVASVSCSGGSNKPNNDDGDGGAGGDDLGGQSGASEGGNAAGGDGGRQAGGAGGMGGIPSPSAGSGGGGMMNAGGMGGMAGKPGTGGVPPATGGTPGGVLAPECSNLTNCDTFEGYAVGNRPSGPWTNFEVENGGTLTVDGTRGFKGSQKSVKVTVSSGGTARMRHSGNGILPAEGLYMRMMVWMDAPPKGSGHWNWMWAEGATKSSNPLADTFMASGGQNGTTWMLYGGGARGGGYQDCFAQAGTKFPLGRWACYEFHLDGKTNSGKAWVDGKLDELVGFEEAMSLTGQCLPGHNLTDGLWYVPSIDRAFFGFKVFHTIMGTATAWLDDIAISRTRIGCPAP